MPYTPTAFNATDDRGREARIPHMPLAEACLVLDPIGPEWPRTPHGAADVIARLVPTQEVYTSGPRKTTGTLAIVLAACISIGCLVFLLMLYRDDPSLGSDIVVIALGLAATPLVLVALSLWEQRREQTTYPPLAEAITTWIAQHGCPACGYRIIDLRPEPDGCIVCPECGASWRMPARPPADTHSTPTRPS